MEFLLHREGYTLKWRWMMIILMLVRRNNSCECLIIRILMIGCWRSFMIPIFWDKSVQMKSFSYHEKTLRMRLLIFECFYPATILCNVRGFPVASETRSTLNSMARALEHSSTLKFHTPWNVFAVRRLRHVRMCQSEAGLYSGHSLHFHQSLSMNLPDPLFCTFQSGCLRLTISLTLITSY